MPSRAIMYSAHEEEREVELQTELVRALVDETLLWVDFDELDERGIREAAETLDLPPEAIEGILQRGTRAELQRLPEMIRLRMVAIRPGEDDEGRELSLIDIVAARNRVLTVHRGRLDTFEVFARETRGESVLGRLHAAGFVSALVDTLLGEYLAVVEEVEQRVDALDEQALRTADPEVFLRDVVALRRRVGTLRRALAPLRVALAPLGRPDAEIPELGEPWPGLLERLERVIDTVENARELLIGSFDVFMARHAERTNDIMKALTILNAVLLPAVVVAGVMGMNFRLGFFEDAANFWFVVLAMLALAVGILGFSRWRGWI